MIVLIGTIPLETGLYVGPARIEKDALFVGADRVPIERGSAAMAASCVQACTFYGLPMPVCIFGGDTGTGAGTGLMFEEVIRNLHNYAPEVVTLHYLFPKIAFGRPLIEKIASLAHKPQLVADAGGMYLIKSIKKSSFFDVFTPDRGELLFLADELAGHPIYVRSETAPRTDDTDALAARAYKQGDAPATLLVKGAIDSIYLRGTKVGECASPNLPAMEAIGGTGDTITGMLSAFRFAGDSDAELKASRVNRLIGEAAKCTPATQIIEFIEQVPFALERYETDDA